MSSISISPLFLSIIGAPAVVGAGIGGSATAHFLRQHFGPEVQVDVFEKGEVGGRLATVSVNNHDYESGGSIIHSLNLHMQEFVKQLGWFNTSNYTNACLINGQFTVKRDSLTVSLFLFKNCIFLNLRAEVPSQHGR